MVNVSTIQKQSFNIHYRPGTADEKVLNESFENDLFFPGMPEFQIKPDHVIIDIGAHIGSFSILAASKVPAGKVYSFEPSADSFRLLHQNVITNKISNIRTFHMAVTEKNGQAVLYHDLTTGNWGHTLTKAISAETENVDCITLESFLRSEKISHVDLIKFNCEGAEFGILINTPGEILRPIKCMLILYHGYLEERYSVKQLSDHLRSAGYNIHRRYVNKDDDSGWLVAYRAGFIDNIIINVRTAPLRFYFFRKEIRRKFRRAKQILLRQS